MELDVRRNPALLKLDLYCKGMRIDDSCLVEQAAGQDHLEPAAERLDDAAEVGRLDEAFHATLVRAAGNEEIARVHWDVTERIRFVRRLDFTRSDRIEATYQEHAKILRQVMQRRAEPAQLLLAAHIEQSKAAVRRITLSTLHEARARASSQ